MNVLDEILNDARGVEIISDWLGAGGVPVEQHTAEYRAFTCELCSENRPGNWWDQVKNSIATWIGWTIEVKNRMKLEVPNENKLGICRACGCCNRLKIWTPIEHIKTHTSFEVSRRFPGNCWIISELSEL